MGQEIERKFRVINNNYKIGSTYTDYKQGYLSTQKERTVRVRVADNLGYITIKGANQGVTRSEFEYQIPLPDALHLLTMCIPPIIEKRRYTYTAPDNHTWEIDEFLGANQGLVVAEIELAHPDEEFIRPPWIGCEVSDDARYYNSNLVDNPYCVWGDRE